jgi:hypothetical protein
VVEISACNCFSSHVEANISCDGNKSVTICIVCRNFSIGLATKAKACKGAGQEGSPGITSHAPRSVGECEGMNSHTPKWAPLWELESRWTSEFSKNDCRSQNPWDWKVPYIIGNLLEFRCLKWACITHLDT